MQLQLQPRPSSHLAPAPADGDEPETPPRSGWVWPLLLGLAAGVAVVGSTWLAVAR